MVTPILATKLYIPPLRPKIIIRRRLIDQLLEGLFSGSKLTLISASAGFGKTTLVSEWAAECDRPVAWLSLDEGDNDPSRFLNYLVAALQTVLPNIGSGVLAALERQGPPCIESILTALLNDITSIPDNIILTLDDYHVIEAKPVEKALAFLLEHLPHQMHIVIVTREDPQLPLSLLRARGHLTELRSADLRFDHSDAAKFLNQVMCLNLSSEDIAALETRTEGWIAGLQLVALSMHGHQDTAGFIKSFTGSHHFVIDYLIEEVLQKQSENVQSFLLRTSILDRMCGPLCDAVLDSPSTSGQEVLEYLDRVNLFIVPLDNDRRWYRYHHLFAELLRQRFYNSISSGNEEGVLAEYHIRASRWFEDHDLHLEAFKHAAEANDVERAERIIESKGFPLHFSGALVAILDWLKSLQKAVLDTKPSLCVRYATLSLVSGQTTGVEEKLQVAETALTSILRDTEPDNTTRDLIGQIAAARATLALTRYQPEAMITQSCRALEYLDPCNLLARIRAIWTRGFAYQVKGDRFSARQAYVDAIAISQESGNIRFLIVATISLGVIEALDNQFSQALETFRLGLDLSGEYPQPFENEAHLGLARIYYEWNDLDAAEKHGQQSLQLARQFDNTIDRYIFCEVFLARLKLAQGDVIAATAMLEKTEQSVHHHNFLYRKPEVTAAQVLTLLRRGDVVAAARLVKNHDLPLSRARIFLAQGNPAEALEVLASLYQKMKAKGWQDEQLKVMVLQAVALHAHGDKDEAVQMLENALAMAESGGFIRLFLDEGIPMINLLSDAAVRGFMPDYVRKLLTAFKVGEQKSDTKSYQSSVLSHIEPLSQRELEVLQLIAKGLSNHEICERLYIALDTVKGHNRKIYEKLQVHKRTEAVARAHELDLL